MCFVCCIMTISSLQYESKNIHFFAPLFYSQNLGPTPLFYINKLYMNTYGISVKVIEEFLGCILDEKKKN